jgi:leucyl-tRNA synthetase
VKCPKCNADAKRDPDTMDTFVDSSWYYFRFLNPNITSDPFDKELSDNWIPVDMYVGGAEHATMHLLYARFIHKFIRDIGYTNSDEPFSHLIHQGTITNQGAKMSKSKGNVVNPDQFINKYGSDVFRMYLMFMGPYELGGDWSDKGITGTDRFVQRTYELFSKFSGLLNQYKIKVVYELDQLNENEKAVYKKVNQTLKKLDEELHHFRFNTAIAALMELLNEMKKLDSCSNEIQCYTLVRFASMMAPLAPHLAEECYSLLGSKESIFQKPFWFEPDPKALVEDLVSIAVQVNGKLRGTVELPINSSQNDVKNLLLNEEKIKKHLDGKEIVKEIYVPNKIYNIVVK